ncbi:MAG: hypothetical protein J6X35_03340, partial [Bacteroidales bacterium]|nr:hypothetical protein [Bacteroidales bacterium]
MRNIMAKDDVMNDTGGHPAVRYSDEELQEFKEIILEKLAKARSDMESFRSAMNGSSGNDTTDTAPTFKILEEGQQTLFKE